MMNRAERQSANSHDLIRAMPAEGSGHHSDCHVDLPPVTHRGGDFMSEQATSLDQPKRRADRTPTNATSFQFQFPSSAKIHINGVAHPDVRLAMREVSLTSTRHGNVTEPNDPMR